MLMNTIQTRFKMNTNTNLELEPVYDSICQYCGKPFNKPYKTVKYCCDDCRHKALQDQKAAYQRKRRWRINHGFLISNETKKVGTNYLSEHKHDDLNEEWSSIQKEMHRIGLR